MISWPDHSYASPHLQGSHATLTSQVAINGSERRRCIWRIFPALIFWNGSCSCSTDCRCCRLCMVINCVYIYREVTAVVPSSTPGTKNCTPASQPRLDTRYKYPPPDSTPSYIQVELNLDWRKIFFTQPICNYVHILTVCLNYSFISCKNFLPLIYENSFK